MSFTDQAATYAALRARETAVLRVNGKDFYNWESVYIEHEQTASWPIFRFTSAEDMPPNGVWLDTQLRPQDKVAIYLGGQLAVTGLLISRQTAYNSQSHGVMLHGYGLTWAASTSSHMGNANFDGLTYAQIVDRVLAPFPNKATFLPDRSAPEFNTAIKPAQTMPGELNGDFFERIGRIVGVIRASDRYGNMLFIAQHAGDVVAELIEGVNIVRCQAIMSVEGFFSDIWLRSQQAGSDDVHGRAASEQEAHAPGNLNFYRPLLTPCEQPCSNDQLRQRAQNEAKWGQGTDIEVTIVVQGWFRPDGKLLWQAGDNVRVKSPSAMLDMMLKIRKVIFSQDRNQGTLTTLELVAPWMLNDRSDINLGNSNAPQPPLQGSITNTQPIAPLPTAKPAQPPADKLD